jgi:PilX N-terminal
MRSRIHQQGMTLVITMLFLVVIAMFAITTYSTSTTNMQVTGNMVVRNEAIAAAQARIDETISSNMFTSDPEAVKEEVYQVDIDGDGVVEEKYVTQLDPAPACYRTRTIKTTELDLDVPDDVKCMGSSGGMGSLIEPSGAGAASGSSLCSETEWNVRATVTHADTGTNVAIDQGVGIRVLSTDAADFCS